MDAKRPLSPLFGEILDLAINEYQKTLHEVVFTTRAIIVSDLAIAAIAGTIDVQVITADTFGLASSQLSGLPVSLTITPLDNHAETKLDFITRLGASSTVALGNGRNDRRMLEAAAEGIALLQHPKRLTATLRS